MPKATVDERESVEGGSILNGTEALPMKAKERLAVLQRLKNHEGTQGYKQEQIKATKELGISLRSQYRYIRQYRKQGIEGISRRERSDRGEVKGEHLTFAMSISTQQKKCG
jgi:transposase